MPLLSHTLGQQPADQQRKMYAAWQQATKRGDVPALKLLTRFNLMGAKGQPRTVFDYAYTEQHAPQVAAWFAEQQVTPRVSGGITAEQAAGMTDEQLMALIQQAKTTKKRTNKRKEKAAKIEAAPIIQEAINAVQDVENVV